MMNTVSHFICDPRPAGFGLPGFFMPAAPGAPRPRAKRARNGEAVSNKLNVNVVGYITNYLNLGDSMLMIVLKSVIVPRRG